MIATYKGNKVVRCGGKAATPYLRKNIDLFLQCSRVLDLGCGEGRNSRYLKEQGLEVLSFDRCPDYGMEWHAADYLPVEEQSVDGIVINYLLMFLTTEELQNVARQVDRVAKPGAILMVELEVVKSSYIRSMTSLTALKYQFMNMLEDWEIVKESRGRFIVRKAI